MPREGHDGCFARAKRNCSEFQSTCPARGTTLPMVPHKTMRDKISIHVPREGHDREHHQEMLHKPNISIHVPREGHDSIWLTSSFTVCHFNPRAPRGARQPTTVIRADSGFKFQSTCPARGTTARVVAITSDSSISIHVPREGHDVSNSASIFRRSISIHVPREGHDQIAAKAAAPARHFNPRAPRGARRRAVHC